MRTVRALIAVVALVFAGVVAGASPATAKPTFKAPFPCGQTWTYSHHSSEVRLALDFVDTDGNTDGAPVLASAAGTVSHHWEAGGAGNYVVIDHGEGWQTYYFHLSAFSTADGAQVAQGQQIGVTGSTGASSGPHQHYEQLYNGQGQTIEINGQSLAPYPGSYFEKSITSDNCGGDDGGGDGHPFRTWGAGVNVRAESNTGSAVVGTLGGPTDVNVVCQEEGETVTAEGYTNAWWSKLAGHNGYITNIYIDHPASKLPGVPLC